VITASSAFRLCWLRQLSRAVRPQRLCPDGGAQGDWEVCRGAWAPVTMDQFRHLEMQTF
jgi:hypothetical protein